MAWNEPGGNRNNDRDPWGSGNRGGNNDQGPPDLDEALKKAWISSISFSVVRAAEAAVTAAAPARALVASR